MTNFELWALYVGIGLLTFWVLLYAIGKKDMKTPFSFIAWWIIISTLLRIVSGKDMTEYAGGPFDSSTEPTPFLTIALAVFWLFQFGAIPWLIYEIVKKFRKS